MITSFIKRALIAGMIALTLAAGITPSASAATTYSLTIVRLECIIKQDSGLNGKDEPRVKIDGITVFAGDGFTDGTSRNISMTPWVMQSSATVEVWEFDTTSKDDFIGSFKVTGSNDVGKGDLTKYVGGSDGKYMVVYRVT